MDEATGRVGIVTRTRDRTMFVVRALASVLAQTHADWNVALVNDGGDAQALRRALADAGLAARLGPARLTILDNPTSRGRAAAFNQGLEALEGEFVACLDDDDTWAPDFLAALVAHFRQNAPLIPDLGGVAAAVTALREDVVPGPDGRDRIAPLGEDGLPNAFRRSDFLIGPIAYATYRHDLYPVQWMLRRDAVAELGGFPEDFEVMEDRAFLTRFLQRWRLATLDRPLAFHHRRVRRREDTGRSAALNTLDNPSYDWRRFADLALPPLTSPGNGAATDLPALVRAVGVSVVRELNDETSALWHKINGEAEALRARLDAIEARIGGGMAPDAPAPPTGEVVWSLWPAVGARPIGYALAPATPFLDRLEISCTGQGDGLLLHADPARRTFRLQVPQTGVWCALELSLKGLALAGRGLTIGLSLGIAGGGLFQTGLVRTSRDLRGRARHDLVETHVHAADSGVPLRLERRFEADVLTTGGPKFSIILPRQAANLTLHLGDLVVTTS